MIKLYLIRHGETDWNISKRFQGWTDIELNEKGLNQAKLLGERLKNICIDEIYASPLIRAVKTAEPVANAHGLDIKLHDSFKEINFGSWEGMTRDELYEKFPVEFDEFVKRPEECGFPGEGSFDNIEKRIKIGLDEILEGKDGKSIAIVSHGGIIRLIIKYLMGFENGWYRKTWIDNTSITLIEIKEKGNLLRVFNDSSHIDNNGVL